MAACSQATGAGEQAESPSPVEETHDLTVQFTAGGALSDGYFNHGYWAFGHDNGTCDATGGSGAYASKPFDTRIQVTVADAAGVTVGVGTVPDRGEWRGGSSVKGTCTWTVSIAELPRSDFYTLRVTEFDDRTFAFDELDAAGWSLEIPLNMT